MVVAENVGFRLEADVFKSLQIIKVLAVMDNTETSHHKRIVAAETVGFRFEADLFKSVQMILGFCCHG